MLSRNLKQVNSINLVRNFGTKLSKKSSRYAALDAKYVTPYYAPMPVVIDRGEGIHLWDVDGNKYYDMLAGFACVSQGHCHPKITEAVIAQSQKLTMTSRSLMNSSLPVTAELICNLLGYDKYLPASSGVEACEAAVKLARKWGYTVKGVEEDRANIILANDCFWGRSITASGACSDPARYTNFGPHTPGFQLVPYNDVESVRQRLDLNPNTVAVMVEAIQGEGGVIVPEDGYLYELKKLCDEYNCLLVIDEVQTGLGRTGKLMASNWDLEKHGMKPDILTLGKALSGGVTPVSGIVADKEVMDAFKLGDHGSTFGGNPMSMAIAKAALTVLVEEDLVRNSQEVGSYFQQKLKAIDSPMIKDIRGRGMMNALEIESDSNVDGHIFCDMLRSRGVLTKATKNYSVRFTPALNMQKDQVDSVVEIVEDALWALEQHNKVAHKLEWGQNYKRNPDAQKKKKSVKLTGKLSKKM